MDRIPLRYQFYNYLQENCLGIFSTKDALVWYREHKNNPNKVNYPNLYTVILHPLLLEEMIKKTPVKGTWEVTSHKNSLQTLQIGEIEDQDPEEREFLEYLKSKGVTRS